MNDAYKRADAGSSRLNGQDIFGHRNYDDGNPIELDSDLEDLMLLEKKELQ